MQLKSTLKTVRLFTALFSFILLQSQTANAQCTPVGGASGTVQNSTGTTPISFTVAVSSTASITSLGAYAGQCGFTFPGIVTPWSGNTNTISTVTYTFSHPITSIDIFIGYTGVNTYIRPESFTFTTDTDVPTLSVNSGTCVDWTINGNQTTSPNILHAMNSIHTVTTVNGFTTLTIATNSGHNQNGGSSYALCDGSLVLECPATSSQVSVTSCDSYTFNSQTYDSTGIYTQVLTNSAGCDSVITLDLVINDATTSSLTETACNSYTFNSQTYSSSGIYTQTIPNAAGCDSTITLDLTINNATSSALTETACNSYTLNSQTYSSSGVYTQTLTNSAGCDSVISLDLTINNSTASSLTETACDGYTLNSQLYTSSGIYTQTIPNSAGCDSTITLDLEIVNSTTSHLIETACDFYELNGQTYVANGTYTQTLSNSVGCDSTITLDLEIVSSSASSQTETACDYFDLNGQTYTSTGTYTQTIPNAAGCDSTITLDLTIPEPDVSVTVADTILTASNSATAYQWIDCENGNATIAGATSQSFVPYVAGEYAVIVTEDVCTDTSNCYSAGPLGLVENSFATAVTLFPNPTNGLVYLDLGQMYNEVAVRVLDIAGRAVWQSEFDAISQSEFRLDVVSGVYFVQVSSIKGAAIFKLVVNR